ncbi:hypothetical protein K2173_021864 [Erythroxylum novogranatense]|uniref:Phorbol-ester/DAG-type domain-containing protein n=1 Tax=Erythroxylum novogranatense TaxID=1862640 RepID=A0AAV8T241_9ROSI|nr:hypothetical protein K2173_021864 [Erythroxylum novogranatense]
MQIKDFKNDHALILFDVRMNEYCYGCKAMIYSWGYTCDYCKISLHKQCATLPLQIRHPLHSSHLLNLVPPHDDLRFICDGCDNFCYGCDDPSYECKECGFVLDIKCASLFDAKSHKFEIKKKGSKVTLPHFIHKHTLKLANFVQDLKLTCSMCFLFIEGEAYCCVQCEFFLHKSCCDETPQYIQHQFHSHQLELGEFHFYGHCDACDFKILDSISYRSHDYRFHFHITCVKYLTSNLKYKFHEHNLFYFVAKDDLRDLNYYLKCKSCHQYCKESFYRCIECNLNFHIHCIPIPEKVKGICHIHPLTLMDSVSEDARNQEYYCHWCEKPRNPKHSLYSCKKCPYTAHIGCVLDEVCLLILIINVYVCVTYAMIEKK